MLLGMFKKVVIADRVADYVNTVYEAPELFKGLQVWIATMFFYVQIYCDFSGYSDIAIGAAAVMGYKLMTNFRQPFFADDLQDWWRRWHISLTTWFRDYVYAELGGKKKGVNRWYFNILAMLVITGFWHGANWTFVLFGLAHAILFIGTIVFRPSFAAFKRKIGLSKLVTLNRLINIFLTIHIGGLTILLFRSKSVSDAWQLFSNMFKGGGTNQLNLFHYPSDMMISIIAIMLLVCIELAQERKVLKPMLAKLPLVTKWSLLILVLVIFSVFAKFDQQNFIYFQF